MTSNEFLETLTEKDKDNILAFNTLLGDEIYKENFVMCENDAYKRGRLDVVKLVEMKLRGVDDE